MIRAALIGVLAGMLLGGGTVAWMTVGALQETTADQLVTSVDIRAVRADIRAIRKYSNVNAEEVLDGAVRADAMAQARLNATKLPMKTVAKKLKSPKK